MMRGSSSGMGGGSMLRAVGAGVEEALSSAAGVRPARVVSVVSSSTSSSSTTTTTSPPSFAAGASTERAGWQQQHPHPCFCDGDGWESVGEDEIGEAGSVTASAAGYGFPERFVFGTVPSKEEAVEVVSTIQQIFVPVTFSQVIEDRFSASLDKDEADMTVTDTVHGFSSCGSESDWIEPAPQLYSGDTVQSQTRDKVLDAFRLLQINPSIQRMVVSLSSDKAVWDAVMNNEGVQEIREAFYAAENSKPPKSDEGPDVAPRILRWILGNTKAKILEFVDKITMIVNKLLHPFEEERKMDLFEDALKSSFLLSVVVFIVVVITRAHKG